MQSRARLAARHSKNALIAAHSRRRADRAVASSSSVVVAARARSSFYEEKRARARAICTNWELAFLLLSAQDARARQKNANEMSPATLVKRCRACARERDRRRLRRRRRGRRESRAQRRRVFDTFMVILCSMTPRLVACFRRAHARWPRQPKSGTTQHSRAAQHNVLLVWPTVFWRESRRAGGRRSFGFCSSEEKFLLSSTTSLQSDLTAHKLLMLIRTLHLSFAMLVDSTRL